MRQQAYVKFSQSDEKSDCIIYARSLCGIAYTKSTGNGAALAALWCMQPYNDSTKSNAGQRSIGTLIGSAFGLAFLLILRPLHIPKPAVVYLIASAVIIPVIYTTVLMNKRTAAMIYPALSFDNNVPMLFALFDADAVRDDEKRVELLKTVDLKNFAGNAKDVPQFIAWGTNDKMLGTTETPAYIEAARNVGTDVTEVKVEGQDHGFGQEYYMKEFVEWFSAITGRKDN